MSVLDPEIPRPPDAAPPEPLLVPKPAKPHAKDVCGLCKRPAIDWGDGSVTHIDASVDAANGGSCVAELYVEPPIHWGHLNDPRPTHTVNN